jgi:osmotically inducible protein OsmC
VTIEQDSGGFTVTRSDLDLTADVPGLDEQRLRALADEAKANCPISKLLDAEMDLKVQVTSDAAA